MDKENEIEVIDTLNKFASLTFLYGGRICFFDEQLKKYQKAVKDMLNLYKEEKQAVRTKIIGKIDSVSLDDLIGDEYIRKDKIKEKLNRIKTDENYPKFADYKWSDIEKKLFWEADVLEELLED